MDREEERPEATSTGTNTAPQQNTLSNKRALTPAP